MQSQTVSIYLHHAEHWKHKSNGHEIPVSVVWVELVRQVSQLMQIACREYEVISNDAIVSFHVVLQYEVANRLVNTTE